MLYRILKSMIEADQPGMQEKLDMLFALGRLTAAEYQQLTGMIVI